jgi:hypothetical protein
LLAFLLVVTPVVSLLTSPARAVDLTLFELDGNPTDSLTTSGEDASTLRLAPEGSKAVAILDTIDPVNSNLDVTFDAGGGANTAKDLGDISEWRWVSKATQDKLDLRDVLSAQYRGPGDEPHLYLAATRFGGTGTSTVGFWFLQQTIELGPNGTFVDAENPTQLGRHVEGDILVVADFESSSNKLDIYEWRSGAPVLVYSTTLTCVQAGNERACGVANATQVPSPWPLQLKSAPPNMIPAGQYLEVGRGRGRTVGG